MATSRSSQPPRTVLACALLATAAIGGEPQCPPTPATCYYYASDVRFGDGLDVVRTAQPPYDTLTGAVADDVCSARKWVAVDNCAEQCPLRFTITAPASLEGITACMQDNTFSPYDPSAHIDEDHPLNGRELEVVAVGGAEGNERKGCKPEDFTVDPAKNFTGKIALARRGGCYFYKKFNNAFAVGAALGLMSNSWLKNAVRDQLTPMTGTSVGFPGMPAVILPRHYGDLIFDTLDAGMTVMGKVVFSCAIETLVTSAPMVVEGGGSDSGDDGSDDDDDDDDKGDDDDDDDDDDVSATPTPTTRSPAGSSLPALFDGCPDLRLRDLCGGAAWEEDRLCSTCAVAMQLEGTLFTTCLWGNNLSPRAARNYLQHTRALPFDVPAGEWLWVTSLPQGGCVESDFEGMAGKVILAEVPKACLPFQALRMASRQGLAGFVLMNTALDQPDLLVEGSSAVVAMPVHAIEVRSYELLRSTVEDMGLPFAYPSGAVGRLMPALRLAEGVFDGADIGVSLPVLDSDFVAPPTPEIVASGLQLSSRLIGCIVGSVFLLVAIALFYARQRARTIDIADGDNHSRGVPLGLASLGLSLSLLAVTAGVAFTLAFLAGRKATETAMEDGQDAANLAYLNAVDNVEDLAGRLRTGIISQVRQGIIANLETGEATATAAAINFIGFNGTWNSFYQYLPQYQNLCRRIFESSWVLQVFTTNGFFANIEKMSDNRPDADRDDRVVGSIDVTNEGWRYGNILLRYNELTHLHEFWSYHHQIEFNLSHQLGERFGDPLSVTQGRLRDHMHWHVTRKSFPQQYRPQFTFEQPISVFTPLYNRDNVYLGTIESRTQFSSFGDIISASLSDPEVQNMSVAVFDDGLNIIGTNAFVSAKMRGMVYRTVWRRMWDTFTMHDLPPVHIKAFANYMDAEGGWSGHRGMFEQRAWWTPQALTVMRIRATADGARDISGDENYMEMHNGACGDCGEVDPATRTRVLQFDGGNVLYVLRNLTLVTPRVAETRVPTPDGSWASSLPEFSNIAHIPGTKVSCPIYTDRLLPWEPATSRCLLREQWSMSSYTVSLVVKPDPIAAGFRQITARSPVLFTDSIAGESYMRLYGDGMLKLGVLMVGCQTQAHPGGIPAGVWTTVTGVVDYEAKTCAVYVNGTLSSRATISAIFLNLRKEARLQDLGQPYYVGVGYRGLMDNVTVHNISLSGAEVASIHETGELVRNVPTREWYSDLQPLAAGGLMRTGTDWAIAAMIPRADIMRQADTNNRITSRNLEIQEENTRSHLYQNNTETIGIVIVIALASVLIFLVFNDALTRPFAQYAVVMMDAAVMRVDTVEETSTSFVRELNTMNKAMTLMVRNLKEYKSYMPQHLQFETTDDETECVMSNPSDTSKKANSAVNVDLGSVSLSFGEHDDSRAGSRLSSNPQAAVAHVHMQRQGMGVALFYKRISFVVCNVKGFLRTISSMSDAAVIRRHSELLSLTLNSFAANKGVSEVFCGDKFVASFNAARPCSMHRTSACNTALQLKTETQSVLAPHHTSMNFACVSGEGRVGNCGNEQMKKFTFMTPVLSWGHGLERVGVHIDVPIVVDAFVYSEDVGLFQFKYLNSVVYAKRADKAIRIAELIGASKSPGGEEWMYELQAAKAHPHAAWNAFVDAVLTGIWDEAEELVLDAELVESGPHLKCLKEQLALKRLAPLELLFH